MSFTETTMFGRHIWGSDLSLDAAARRAGWSRADLAWESLLESANKDVGRGDTKGATRKLWRARLIALFCFPRSDLRRATSLANLGILDMARSRKTRGRARIEAAVAHWRQHSDRAVEAMQIAPRARSSLFHLRMEALHRDEYHGNLRKRIGLIAGETCESLLAHLDETPLPHRHYTRWKGERPTVYDDTRKVLAACLLLHEKI